MKDTFYFSHDYNARDDEKILNMMADLWMEWYWIYWALIETLVQNWWKLWLNTIKWIAYKLRCDNTVITDLLHNYNLFKIDEKEWVFYNNRLLNHLSKREDLKKKKSEAWKKWMAKRWEKHNSVITENNSTITNDNKVKESKVKESKVKESKGNSNILSKDNKELALKKREDIDLLIETLKTEADRLWIAYDKTQERNFGKHICTAKEYWSFCEKIWQERIEFAKNIMIASAKMNFWKGACSWPKSIYQNYSDVYNKFKGKQPTKIINIT